MVLINLRYVLGGFAFLGGVPWASYTQQDESYMYYENASSYLLITLDLAFYRSYYLT